MQQLIETANALFCKGEGWQTIDECDPKCNRRIAKFGIGQTDECSQAYGDMILATPGSLARNIAGGIGHDRAKRDGQPCGAPLITAGRHCIASDRHNSRCSDTNGFDALTEIAQNLHWPWNRATGRVRQVTEPDSWAITIYPWLVLLTKSRDHIRRVLWDVVGRREYASFEQDRRQIRWQR